MSPATHDHNEDHAPRGPFALLALGALGVVYGDIGTSPLYSLQVAFGPTIGMEPNRDSILGILSMFIWALIIVVTIKYVGIVTRASNKGEGGDLALQSLALRVVSGRGVVFVTLVGILAVALFSSDAILTPSISVLSAVEGAGLRFPETQQVAVEIALVILTGLFLMQRWGTASVGKLFGPIMVLWFGAIGVMGAIGIAKNPGVVRAISPSYAVMFAIDHPLLTFVALSAVTLCITGAEALYADMGHFGRGPIALSWLVVVFPALVLNYLGQGALLLDHPNMVDNPFFHLVPSGFELPLVVLATVATVIASQAVISGAYSVSRQAMQLGLLPRMRVIQTSVTVRGQIFVPVVTLILYIAVVATPRSRLWSRSHGHTLLHHDASRHRRSPHLGLATLEGRRCVLAAWDCRRSLLYRQHHQDSARCVVLAQRGSNSVRDLLVLVVRTAGDAASPVRRGGRCRPVC